MKIRSNPRVPVWFAALLLAAGLVGAARMAKADMRVYLDANGTPEFVFDTEPNLVLIPNTRAYYANEMTAADVYRVGSTWFTYYDGDWYRSRDLDGPWVRINDNAVPDQVVSVPVGYSQYHRPTTVRYPRQTAYVSPVDFTITRRPRLVLIPSTSNVEFASDYRDGDLYRVGSNWYVFHDGDWYRAGDYRGPWMSIETREVPTMVVSAPYGYHYYPHTTIIRTRTTASTAQVRHVRHITRHRMRRVSREY
jgi:hypothetical protein